MKKVIDEIEKYVKQAPQLPVNFKEFLVRFAPWAAIISVIILIPSLLGIFGLSSYLGVYGLHGYGLGQFGFRYTLLIVFLIANVALRALSIKGLFDKKVEGWNYLFYSVLLYFGYAIHSNFSKTQGINAVDFLRRY